MRRSAQDIASRPRRAARRASVAAGAIAIAVLTGALAVPALATPGGSGSLIDTGEQRVLLAQQRTYDGNHPRSMSSLAPHVSVVGLSRTDLATVSAMVAKISMNTVLKPVIARQPGATTIVISYDDRSEHLRWKDLAGTVCGNESCTTRNIYVRSDDPQDARERTCTLEHEFLHALGLGHSTDKGSVMYFSDYEGTCPLTQQPEYDALNRLYRR